MDCNRVFMILTRGPFPTGEAWDEELEPFRHAGEGAPVRWLHQVG